MTKSDVQHIGKVKLITPIDHKEEPYQDSAEDELLNLFEPHHADVSERVEDILANNPSWAMYYHLSPTRHNLLRWYEFRKKASILEVGAGCGAITEELVRRDCDVTALELTKKRALINAHRNHTRENLTVLTGNLDSYDGDTKFDYVVCVGVLEYAGTFYHSSTPYRDFLMSLGRFLKPKGRMLLAIENRFGLKYWSGAKEDHTQTYFEGHNGYPGKKRVQTFGKKELKDLIISAGFQQTNFYYPYPDYKTPFFVYSDEYYPGNGAQFPLGRLPTPTFDRPREFLFSEQSTMRFLESNNLFPEFSNSFLVEVVK